VARRYGVGVVPPYQKVLENDMLLGFGSPRSVEKLLKKLPPVRADL
jgi:hypothetical protein